MAGAAREKGYAMIAAVATTAFFAYVAFQAVASARSALTSARAEAVRARLSADADAGMAFAAHGLGLEDPAQRWRLTGERREVEFDGAKLVITVEDESGKIPLNFIDGPQLVQLFSAAGASDAEAGALSDELLAERKADPRGLSALDQLAALKGMTPAIYARIGPVVTIASPIETFDPRTASPLALSVMRPGLRESPANEPLPAPSLTGRAFTIRVEATDGRGGGLWKTYVVEMTGSRTRPYLVRSLD
jgi:general secretion pathway protein K